MLISRFKVVVTLSNPSGQLLYFRSDLFNVYPGEDYIEEEMNKALKAKKDADPLHNRFIRIEYAQVEKIYLRGD